MNIVGKMVLVNDKQTGKPVEQGICQWHNEIKEELDLPGMEPYGFTAKVKDKLYEDEYYEVEVIPGFVTNDARFLFIEETNMRGMAGEPMSVTFLKLDGKVVKFDDIKHLLRDEDKVELEQYLDEEGQSNEASAISWVI